MKFNKYFFENYPIDTPFDINSIVFYVLNKYTLPTFTYGTTIESETKEGTSIVVHISQ